MGTTVVSSSANQHRIARGRSWLEAHAPSEQVLIIGATLGAVNELARSLVQTKGASFGYHRMTLGQLAVVLAQPVLAMQRTVPLGPLGIEAVTNRAVHKLAEIAHINEHPKLRTRAITAVAGLRCWSLIGAHGLQGGANKDHREDDHLDKCNLADDHE
jgi:hypothetical protein